MVFFFYPTELSQDALAKVSPTLGHGTKVCAVLETKVCAVETSCVRTLLTVE